MEYERQLHAFDYLVSHISYDMCKENVTHVEYDDCRIMLYSLVVRSLLCYCCVVGEIRR